MRINATVSAPRLLRDYFIFFFPFCSPPRQEKRDCSTDLWSPQARSLAVTHARSRIAPAVTKVLFFAVPTLGKSKCLCRRGAVKGITFSNTYYRITQGNLLRNRTLNTQFRFCLCWGSCAKGGCCFATVRAARRGVLCCLDTIFSGLTSRSVCVRGAMSNVDSSLYDFDLIALKSQDRLREEGKRLTERLLVRANALGGTKALAEEAVVTPEARKKSIFTLKKGGEEKTGPKAAAAAAGPGGGEVARLLVLNEEVYQACVTALDSKRGFIVREGGAECFFFFSLF